MARAANFTSAERYLEIMAQPPTDKHMSPQAMRLYLQYRLFLVEAQIGDIYRKIDTAEETGTHWTWSQPERDEAKWSSWASLNYLLNARDALKKTLKVLSPGAH